MPEPMTYQQRYEILAGRVAFANYARRQQAIDEGTIINLQAFMPNNDASIMLTLHEGQALTTGAELADYLSKPPRAPVAEPTVPDAPLSLCVIPTDGELTIFFLPGSNGGSPITNYQYSTNGVTFTSFSPAQTASPVTVSGLTNGTVYTIYLRAINAVGSSASSSVTAAPIPTSFTPASIAGLILWLDGQDGTKLVLSGSQVTGWNDSSSATNDFTATGAITYDKPSGINARPALNLTQANATSLARTFSLGADEISLFMVVNQTSLGTGNAELFYTQNNYRYFDLFNNTNPGQSGNLAINTRTDRQDDTGVDIITTPPTIALISVVVSTTEYVYVNGEITDVDGIGTSGLSLSGSLTWAISGGAFAGFVGEVIVYPSALADSDRQRVEGYLAWKWGLQENLSPSNPYYLTPPTGDTAPGAPTLLYILPGNTNAYVYYTAGTGTVVNYQVTTDSGTTYTDLTPPDILSPSPVTGLTNGSAVTVKFRAFNGGGVSTSSNGLSVTPSNPSLPAEWFMIDPTNSSSYSGTGTTVNNIGSLGAAAGTISGAVSFADGTGISRKVFSFTGGRISFGSQNFGTNFTISAWLYPRDKFSINAILANGFPNVNTAGFKFAWNSWQSSDKNILFENGNGTAGNWTVPSTVSNSITMDVWQYLTVILDQSTNTSVFLVNGIPVNVSSITTATSFTTTGVFNVGSYLGGSYSMRAELGVLKVFNSSLTASQVLADFTATRAAFGI